MVPTNNAIHGREARYAHAGRTELIVSFESTRSNEIGKQFLHVTDFSPGGESHKRASEGGAHCECRDSNAARHGRRYAEAKP
jgi:hypothetical protein